MSAVNPAANCELSFELELSHLMKLAAVSTYNTLIIDYHLLQMVPKVITKPNFFFLTKSNLMRKKSYL